MRVSIRRFESSPETQGLAAHADKRGSRSIRPEAPESYSDSIDSKSEYPKRCEARDLHFFAMEIWRRRLIQNEGQVGPMQQLPQTLNTFAHATILLILIV